MRRLKTLSILVLALTFCAPGWAAPGGYLGQTVSSDLRVDGVAVPSGTTVLSPTLVNSQADNGLLRLDDSILSLGAGATAYLESTPSGGVQVAVKTGTVSIESANGESFKLAANSRMELDPQGQVLEGETIEMVPLCTFNRETQKWELIEVPEPQVASRLEAGDVRPGEKGLNEECKEDKPVGFWTRGRKITAGVGGAMILGFGIDELNNDDTTSRPASPIVP